MTMMDENRSSSPAPSELSGFKDALGRDLPALAFENDPEPRERLDFLSSEDRAGYEALVSKLKGAPHLGHSTEIVSQPADRSRRP